MNQTDQDSHRNHRHETQARDAFRVRLSLGFQATLVDEQTLELERPDEVFDKSEANELLTALKRIDREANKTLKILAGKNRLLGDYLNRLNQKLDLVIRYSAFKHQSQAEHKEVSLSETGISFTQSEPLAERALFAVRLVFFPEYLQVSAYARVIRCFADNGRYQIAAEFYKLSDKDRQELARQIFKVQVSERKRQSG